MIKEYAIDLSGCIIKKDDFSRFLSLFEEPFTYKSFSIKFSDLTSISDLSKNDFDSFVFTNKTIKEISIYYHYDNQNTKITSTLQFNYDTFFNYYKVIVSSSDETQYSVLKTKLDEWAFSVRHKSRVLIWNIVSHQLSSAFIFSAFLSAFFVIGILASIKWNASAQVVTMLTLLIYLLFFISIYFLFDFFKFCFPKNEIDFDANKHKKMRGISYFIMTTFIFPAIFMIVELCLSR